MKVNHPGNDKALPLASTLLRNVPSTPLVETRQVGDRLREGWFRKLAQDSHMFKWTDSEIRAAVLMGANDASMNFNIRSPNTRNELMRQGRLVAHPAVREHYDRLEKLRDCAWYAYRELIRDVYHGPSQALVDILGRQKRPDQRHHVAGFDAYVRYVRARQSSRA